MIDALAFLVLGLVGSAHCAGMCGGFALSVALASGPARAALVRDQVLFVLGKASTYVVLGLLLHTLLDGAVQASGLAWLQRAATVATGLVLIAAGAKLWGLRATRPAAAPPFPTPLGRALRAALGAASRLQSAARALGGASGAFAAGLVTGFLPCGLSWSALALATQVELAVALPGLLFFGLGTGPVLVLCGLGGERLLHLSPARRHLGVRIAGGLLIAFGGMTLLRGGWTLDDAIAGTPAPCCPAGDAAHGAADRAAH